MGGGFLHYELWGTGQRQAGSKLDAEKEDHRPWGSGLLPCESLGNLKCRRGIRCRA